MTLLTASTFEIALSYTSFLVSLIALVFSFTALYTTIRHIKVNRIVNSQLLTFHVVKKGRGLKVIAENTGSLPFYNVSANIEGLPNTYNSVSLVKPGETVEVIHFTAKQIKAANFKRVVYNTMALYDDTYGFSWQKVGNNKPQKIAYNGE